MGEFNSDDHYFYYCGQESLIWNVVAFIVNKRVLNAGTWAQSQKQQQALVPFQGKPFNITVIQVYAPSTKAEVKWFYEDLEDLLDLTPKKDVLFIIGDWDAKVGSQEIPEITGKFGLGVQKEAGQRKTEFFPENTLVIANTLFKAIQETTLHMDIIRWSILKSDWLYCLQPKMEKLYRVSKNKTWSWLLLRSWAPYFKNYI